MADRTVQLHLPGTCRKDKRPRPPRRSEAAFQAQLRQALGNLGYGSHELGAERRQVDCPNCAHRFFPTGWQGNTPGAPDLAVFHDGWPHGLMVGFELKGEKTPSRALEDAAAQVKPLLG